MREPSLSQEDCFELLRAGYVLENEHGYTTRLKKGRQYISNINRVRKRPKKFAYKFDYPTWQIHSRLSILERVKNWVYLVTEDFKAVYEKGEMNAQKL